MKKVTKKSIERIIKKLNNPYFDNEDIELDYSKTLILLLSEIRDLLLEPKKCACNVQTDPSKLKKNDILIGEQQ